MKDQLYVWVIIELISDFKDPKKQHRQEAFMLARNMDELLPVILNAKAIGREIIGVYQQCPLSQTPEDLYTVTARVNIKSDIL